jgi:antitoxin component YwqK of YwqJK toxin-antitoxin module
MMKPRMKIKKQAFNIQMEKIEKYYFKHAFIIKVMLICITDAYKGSEIYGSWDNETKPIEIIDYVFKIGKYYFYNIPININGVSFRIKHKDTFMIDNSLQKITIENNEYNIINKYNNNYFSNNLKYIISNEDFKFYENDILIVECKMQNGQPNGQYIEYTNGQISFKGYIKNGHVNGLCTERVDNKIKFFGVYSNRMKHGEVTEFNKDGVMLFDGNYINNYKNGFGEEYYTNKKMKYKGYFKNDHYNEEGSLYNEDGKLIYDGEFKDGLFNGIGTKYYDNNKKMYFGEFKNSHYSGEGTMYNIDGTTIIYQGTFLNNKYHGIGKEYNDAGQLKYEGEFMNGFYFGKGIKYNDKKGTKNFEGIFKNGLLAGKGYHYNYFSGNLCAEGEFNNNVLNGKGKQLTKDGWVSGNYINGQLIV